MIGGSVTILKPLKAVDESTKVWVGALIRELWSFRGLGVTPSEQWSGQDDTRAQDNGAAAVPAY